MKPISILLTVILGLTSLGLVVWIGQYKAAGLVSKPKDEFAAPTVDDLQMPTSGPYGKAEIEETKHNFGSKLVGDEDKHAFTIKNTGEGPLELKLGKPTCQCTVGEISKSGGEVKTQDYFKPGETVSLAPNESVNIVVKWKMQTEKEMFRQQVPVFTTDPDLRQIVLEIVGTVDGAIHLEPGGYWDLGELSQKEPSKGYGIAYSTVFDHFELSEVPREGSATKVTWEPLDAAILEEKKAKSGYKIQAEVNQNVPIGLYRETVELKVAGVKPKAIKSESQDGKPENAEAEKSAAETTASETGEPEKYESSLTFSLAARRSGPIEVRGPVGAGFNPSSNRVIFGDFKASEGKKAKFTFYVKGMDDDLVIKSVEPVDTQIKVTLGPAKPFGNAKTYLVEVEIPPGPVGKFRETNAVIVDLKLNHPEAPDFRLLFDYNAKN